MNPAPPVTRQVIAEFEVMEPKYRCVYFKTRFFWNRFWAFCCGQFLPRAQLSANKVFKFPSASVPWSEALREAAGFALQLKLCPISIKKQRIFAA